MTSPALDPVRKEDGARRRDGGKRFAVIIAVLLALAFIGFFGPAIIGIFK
jgi:hypothetical protein